MNQEIKKFIFFSIVDKYKSKYRIYADVVLYFNCKLLWNRSYYVSTVHSAYPDILGKWNKGKDYKKKYKQYYKSTNTVLHKLFKNSISKLENGQGFQIFQQVAFANQCDLKYLERIKKKYPNIILDF